MSKDIPAQGTRQTGRPKKASPKRTVKPLTDKALEQYLREWSKEQLLGLLLEHLWDDAELQLRTRVVRRITAEEDPAAGLARLPAGPGQVGGQMRPDRGRSGELGRLRRHLRAGAGVLGRRVPEG
ncbi:MAG: hypothetical protein HY744_17075 [Deltaproteobacteria bacterium]|nr:hypothetical protein [Deltaproteobacteria bacterium]